MLDKNENTPENLKKILEGLMNLGSDGTKPKGEKSDELTEKLGNLQSSLDSLRLGLKYLIFDLEATRRENKELRKKLDKYEGNGPK